MSGSERSYPRGQPIIFLRVYVLHGAGVPAFNGGEILRCDLWWEFVSGEDYDEYRVLGWPWPKWFRPYDESDPETQRARWVVGRESPHALYT